MADSSVSSWDPDTVAAQHVVADGMVVYGRVALTRTDAMPVCFLFLSLPHGYTHTRACLLSHTHSVCPPPS